LVITSTTHQNREHDVEKKNFAIDENILGYHFTFTGEFEFLCGLMRDGMWVCIFFRVYLNFIETGTPLKVIIGKIIVIEGVIAVRAVDIRLLLHLYLNKFKNYY
jgi:hypothetical protein